jgi:hypothetical protein
MQAFHTAADPHFGPSAQGENTLSFYSDAGVQAHPFIHLTSI